MRYLLMATCLALLTAVPAAAQVEVAIAPPDGLIMHEGDVTTVQIVWDFLTSRPAMANVRFRLWQGAQLLQTYGLGIHCGLLQTVVHPPNWSIKGTYKDVQLCNVGPIPAWAAGKVLTVDADGQDYYGSYDAAPTARIIFQ